MSKVQYVPGRGTACAKAQRIEKAWLARGTKAFHKDGAQDAGLIVMGNEAGGAKQVSDCEGLWEGE